MSDHAKPQGVIELYLKHRDTQLADLRADPRALAPAFVDELCRYHTGSAMAMRRVAKVDVRWGVNVSSSYILSSPLLPPLLP